MDEHVPLAVTLALRLRGIDVTTAQEDGRSGVDDDILLDRATELRRILVSQDADLLRVGMRRLDLGQEFSGLIYAHQLSLTIGQLVKDLELIAATTSGEEWLGKIEFHPI
jgi:hypothetical protein